MKKIAILILLALTASTALAQTPQQLMLKGNEAYSHGDYEAAADAYEVILATGLQSAELYYNLGNAYYRQEELGQAILNYERALRLNPHFRDARENLDLCYSKTEDGIESLPQIFLVQWAQAIVNWFSPTGWLVAIIILFALLGALVVIFFVSSDYGWRKRSLFLSILVSLLLLLAVAFTIASHVKFNHHNRAIVTSPMIVVKSSPEAHSIDKMILHEGTPVEIEETLGDWHKIHIANGNTGWVEQDDITII